jgi:hypothetical protein
MGNPPIFVNDFLIEERRLENIVNSLANPFKEVAEKGDETKVADDTLFKAVEALTNQVAIPTRWATRPVSPSLSKPVIKQVSFEHRQTGSKKEIQCYRCTDYGHI